MSMRAERSNLNLNQEIASSAKPPCNDKKYYYL